MRLHLRRLVLLAVGFLATSALILNFLQHSPEGQHAGHNHVGPAAPWGPNFHEENVHVHAKELRLLKPLKQSVTLSAKQKVNMRFGRGFGHGMHDHDPSMLATEGAVSGFIPLLGGAPPDVMAPNFTRIWALQINETEDRILTQMNMQVKGSDDVKPKTILVWNGLSPLDRGSQRLAQDKCPVKNCILTDDKKTATSADAILWQQVMSTVPKTRRPPNQIWIAYFLESPLNTQPLIQYKNQVNWTATFRTDSTINTPYEKFVPYRNASDILRANKLKDYTAGKTKHVAWFVSNCGAANGRMQYANELNKHINVDMYGNCGKLKCSRNKAHDCNDLLNKNYKFYLAFENSNCRDYITEKFYWNALYNNIVPIVMGAHPDDYRRLAPPHSYIHVDDFESPKELAEYLHMLDNNSHKYNEYFRWKGTGEFINTKFWCRLCAMVHEADFSRRTWYGDLDKWWRGKGTCTHAQAERWATWRAEGKRQTPHEDPDVLHYSNQ